jgi:hypothetical protein
MKHVDRYALSIIAAFAFAGCGSQVAPTGSAPQSLAPVTHGKSWMLPEAKHEDLVYVSNGPNTLRVFSYPEGKPVGVLDVAHPQASCSDTNGNVYVTSGSEILEYAHGGTVPINTLNIDYDGYVYGCAVDPTTGDVAATVVYGDLDFYVAIFVGGKGNSQNLRDSGLAEYGTCIYDDAGNLYVMGLSRRSYEVGLTELPAGDTGFITLSLSETLNEGGLEWDGQYLDIYSLSKKGPNIIYQVTISGSDATIVSSTQLSGHVLPGQPWLFQGTFAAPGGLRRRRDLVFWNYPAGGKPIGIIPTRYFSHNTPIFDITVSVAPPGPRK